MNSSLINYIYQRKHTFPPNFDISSHRIVHISESGKALYMYQFCRILITITSTCMYELVKYL